MTRQTVDTFDIQYAFPSVGNDGRLERRVFTAPGISEDVSYTYDVLGRLSRAETAGPEWGQSFVYDGFGNLTQTSVVKGSAPAMSLTVNGATNRITTVGFAYDVNGNLTQSPFGTYIFDSVNRLTRAESGAGVEEYGYAANNQRLWKKKADGTVEVYFYLPDGRLIATYEKQRWTPEYPQEFCLKRLSDRIWFGGLLLAADHEAVHTDRLGSEVRKGTQVYRYYPHGEAFGTTPSTTGPEFATYERDQQAGLDQAWNRGYLSAHGRFAQADPYQARGGAGEPGSWNRYGYVGGDPTNFHDPEGLERRLVCSMGIVWHRIAGEWFYGPAVVAHTAPGTEGEPASAETDPNLEWPELSEDCQKGLIAAMPGRNTLANRKAGVEAVLRAHRAEGILDAAARAQGVDWRLLAAIGVRESQFRSIKQPDGRGRGVFQSDIEQNPAVKETDALNTQWAANWAANVLSADMSKLVQRFPTFDSAHLQQATAESWNLGVGGISDNPDTIDVGSTRGNYGSSVVLLMNCLFSK